MAVGSCTNSATRTLRDTSRTASTSGPCSNGWDTATSHRLWSTSRASTLITRGKWSRGFKIGEFVVHGQKKQVRPPLTLSV